MAKPKPRTEQKPKPRNQPLNTGGNWQDRGFGSLEEAQSAQRAFGLQPGEERGDFHKITLAEVQARADALGQGANQTAQTPYNLGGERWLFGAGGVEYTGQRSDAAKRKPGAAWAGNGSPAPTSTGTTPTPGTATTSSQSTSGRHAPWENVDLTGEGVVAHGAAGEDEAEADSEGGKPHKPKKRPAKRATERAKRPKSPGGKKITKAERAKIVKIKARTRGK